MHSAVDFAAALILSHIIPKFISKLIYNLFIENSIIVAFIALPPPESEPTHTVISSLVRFNDVVFTVDPLLVMVKVPFLYVNVMSTMLSEASVKFVLLEPMTSRSRSDPQYFSYLTINPSYDDVEPSA